MKLNENFPNLHKIPAFKNFAENESSQGTCEFDISCHREKRTSLVLNFKDYRNLVRKAPSHRNENHCDHCQGLSILLNLFYCIFQQ